ncbi:MAG: WYL domain-containing protein [Cytophagales bacterium]|nr:WYL domain-containing protein [Cytophagales bacterium]
MSATKKQSLRLEILDELLSTRKWTLEELLERINEKLADGANTIDKRTLFRDIKYLSETKDAPIHRPKKKDRLYYYTEPFSLKNIPLDEDDIASLKSAIQILRQVDNFHLVNEVDDVIKRLENRIHVQTPEQAVLIQFENHTSSQGHEYVTDLLEAIKNKVALRISYQPFTQQQATERVVHGYLLKEFRNRWFLFGREGNASRVTIYALDRIKKIRPATNEYLANDLFDPTTYFKHLIGVSVAEDAIPERLEIKVYKQAVPYILSKPIHLNQEITKKNKDGSILIGLNLIINYELKSILLSYGSSIEVKKPKSFREVVANEIKNLANIY